MLRVGAVVGFYDSAGFDELTMKAIMFNAANTNSNALALDNVMVQLTNRPPTPAIYSADFILDPATRIPSLTIWGTLTGVRYRLVYAEDLYSGVWNPVSAGWESGAGITLTDPGAPGKPQRFYRVEAQ